MSPNLNMGDFVVVNKTSFNSLKIGDIIAFRTFGTTEQRIHEIIVQRVAQIVTDSHADRILRAIGDRTLLNGRGLEGYTTSNKPQQMNALTSNDKRKKTAVFISDIYLTLSISSGVRAFLSNGLSLVA
jgi:signal peptidase I